MNHILERVVHGRINMYVKPSGGGTVVRTSVNNDLSVGKTAMTFYDYFFRMTIWTGLKTVR